MTISKSRLRAVVASSVINRDSSIIDLSSPFDEPEHLLKNKPVEVNVKKSGVDGVDIKYLSRMELRVLLQINSWIINSKNETDRVFLNNLSDITGCQIPSLKKTLQRLQLKGYIERVEYKPGMGGWTSYRISSNIVGQIKEKIRTEGKLY